jgi:hypothetical protein
MCAPSTRTDYVVEFPNEGVTMWIRVCRSPPRRAERREPPGWHGDTCHETWACREGLECTDEFYCDFALE